MQQKVKVIGIGNEFRSDDGAGLFAVRQLKRECRSGVPMLECTGDGTALMKLWSDADVVIIIDAVSSGKPPGSIHRIDSATGKLPSAFSASTHAFGLPEVFALQKQIHSPVPRLIVYGVEGANFRQGVGLSDAVSSGIAGILAMVMEDLGELAG